MIKIAIVEDNTEEMQIMRSYVDHESIRRRICKRFYENG